jgi:hypothetical protein
MRYDESLQQKQFDFSHACGLAVRLVPLDNSHSSSRHRRLVSRMRLCRLLSRSSEDIPSHDLAFGVRQVALVSANIKTIPDLACDGHGPCVG